MCDDGIGARVGRILQALPLPSDVAVLPVQRIGLELLDALAEAEHLMVVDALTSTTEPGTCTVSDVSELPAGTVSAGCAHSGTVQQIIELARQISCDETLQYLTIAGIERAQALVCGEGFSEAVRAAVPRLVDLILLTIGARLEARTMVRETCRNFVLPAAGIFPLPRAEQAPAAAS